MSDHIAPTPGADDGDRPLEPLLRALAEDYHRPPAVPREAMWAAIRAVRDEDRADTGARPVTGDVVALPPVALVVTAEDARAARPARRAPDAATTGRRWAGPIAALAAALLLGVGVGRWTTRVDGSSAAPVQGVAGRAPVVAAIEGAAAGAPDAGAPPQSDDRAAAAAPRNPDAAGGSVVTPGTTLGPGAPPRVQDTPATLAGRDPSAAGPIVAPRPDRLAAEARVRPSTAERAASTYRVAAVQHFGQAEALLTGFRAEPGAPEVTAATDAWARELLTTTRLLMDSPAAADPQLGPLLGDLETVLVQIVHLPAARAARERQLIAQSLDQSQLMTHLRAAVPEGPVAPQRSGE